MATHIKTTDELKDIINKAEHLVVLEFSAKWCSACSLLSPEIEKIAAMNNVINFCIIDVDDNEELADEYNIIALPTVHFIKGDSILDTIIGAKIEKLYSILHKLHPEGPFPEYIPIERKRKKYVPEPEEEVKQDQEGELAAAIVPEEASKPPDSSEAVNPQDQLVTEMNVQNEDPKASEENKEPSENKPAKNNSKKSK